jgi:hypothetical protein
MTYGCGATYSCKSCYPFTYRCECGVDYAEPVPFGDVIPVCDACGLDFQELFNQVLTEQI